MRQLASATIACLILISAFCSPVTGQSELTEKLRIGSLVRVPETAHYYAATMNHEAMYEAVFDSEAWSAIRKSKVSRNMKRAYRKGRSGGYDEYGDNLLATYLQGYGEYVDNVIVNSVFGVIQPLFENEQFVYVDNDIVPLLKASSAMTTRFFEEYEVEDLESLDNSELDPQQQDKLLKIFEESFADVQAPTMMIGCVVSDSEYRGMIELADNFIQTAINSLPPESDWLRDAYQVVDDEKQYVIYVELDFDLLDADQMLERADAPELLERILSPLKGKSACFALGIKENIVFAGIAKDKQSFNKFGSGKRLIDMPKLARLKTVIIDSESPLTSVSYASEEYARHAISGVRGLRKLVSPFAEGMLMSAKENGGLDFALSKEAIVDHANEFFDELESMWPDPAMHYAFSHLTPQGMEGYRWFDGTYPLLDGSKNCRMLDNVGQDTLMFASVQFKDIGDCYRFASKWSRKWSTAMQTFAEDAFPSAFEKIAMAKRALDGNEDEGPVAPEELEKVREVYEKNTELMNESLGFFADLDELLLAKVMPAMKGEGSSVVVDMIDGPLFEESAQSSRIPSLTLIQNHHSAESLGEAFDTILAKSKSHFRDLADDDESQENREAMRNYLESIGRKETPTGSLIERLFTPEELVESIEVDSMFYDATLISKDKLIFRFPQSGIETLTKKRAGSIFGPASEAATKPTTSTFFYSHELLMDTLRLTFERTGATEQLELPQVGEDMEDRNLLEFTPAEIQDHLDRIWNFTECWKGYSMRSYIESGGTATESLFRFEDIKEE